MKALTLATALVIGLNAFCQEHGQLAKTSKFPITREWVFCARTKDRQIEYWLRGNGFSENDRLVSVWQRTYDYSQGIMTLHMILVDRDKKETLALSTQLHDMKSGKILASYKISDEINWRKEPPGTIGYAVFEKLDELELIRKYDEDHKPTSK